MRSYLGIPAVAIGAVLMAAFCAPAARGVEAVGVVKEHNIGDFKLDSADTIRFFKLRIRETQYSPEAWRPRTGDRIRVQYRENESILVVTEVELLSPGPDTVSDLVNPVAVEIAEDMRPAGNARLAAKLRSGHMIDFNSEKIRMDPVGWVPKAGEKAVVEFRAQRNWLDCGVTFVAFKVTKMD